MLLRYLTISLLFLSAAAAHAQTAASMEPVAGFGVGPGQPARAGLFYKESTGKFYGTSQSGGAFGAGTVFEMDETGRIQGLSFTEEKNEQAFPGSRPSSEFVESSDGWLWTTYTNYGLGNAQQLGGIVRLRPETGECQVMARFTGNTGLFPGSWPQGGLVRSADGNLWGTTFYTANNNTGAGTIFRIHEITGEFESVHSFPGTGGTSGGARPQGTLHNDGNGNLWGVTQFAGAAGNGSTSGSGSVFKFNMSTRAITVYNIFAGSNPQEGKITGSFPNNSLVPDGRGFLWGTISKDNTFGSVYKIEAATGNATHVADYNKNGNNLAVQLMRDHQGNLWGYTPAGGNNGVNKGSLFKVDSGTDMLTTEFSFSSLSGANADITGPASALVRTPDGQLWGTATTASGGWAAYKFNPNGAVFTRLAAGQVLTGYTPQAGVVGSPGSNWLWGSTSAGGLHGFGTLYRVDPVNGQMETLVHFTGTSGSAAGAEPSGTLAIAADGIVWGTTKLGGAGNFGTVFKYDPDTTVFTSVHAFTASGNGASPRGLILPGDGSHAWGVANNGTNGIVFKINTATSAFTNVFAFVSGTSTGRSPDCQLVEDASGFLWGTTTVSGANGDGSIFKVDPATGTTTVVYHFNNDSGQPLSTRAGGPRGSLFMDATGHLWGMWNYSSTSGVFRFNTATNTLENFFTDFVSASVYPNLKAYPGTLGTDQDGKLNFVVAESARNSDSLILTREVLFQIDPAEATPVAAKATVLEEGVIYQEGPANLPQGAFYAHSDGFLYGINSARGLNRDLSPAGGGMLYRVRTGPAVTTVMKPDSAYNPLYHSYASRTNATLRAMVSPNEQAITGWEFEWGPTTALGNTVTATPGAASEIGIMSTATLSGLAPYTTYYFRAVVHTAAGASYGRMLTLETDSIVNWPAPEGSQILVESPRGMALPESPSAGSVDLGRLLVGESWKQAVIARSVGPDNLNIQSAVLSGDPAFSIFTEMPIGSLATDKTAGMFVTYAPTSPGVHIATLTITSNDWDDSTYEITFSAEGIQEPDLQVELAGDGTPVAAGGRVDFGSSALGVATPNQTLNVINAGNATLENISVEIVGAAKDDYGLVFVPGASLLEGGSTNLVVSFTPSQAGTRTATLRIRSNDPDQPEYDISLTGASLAMPEIVVETSGGTNLVDGSGTIQFGNVPVGGSGSQQIVIKNTGNAPLTGISVNVIGQPQYTVTVSAPATIAAGASATVEITLSPLAAVPVIAQLEISSNDSDENPFNLTLNGSGISAPEIAVEVGAAALADGGPAVAFGSVSAGLSATRTFTIRNAGNEALTGLVLSLDGAGFSNTGLGQTSLAAGQSLTFDVTFSPSAEGDFSATLQIASNDADENPFDIALTGTATAQVGGKPVFGPITLGPSSVAQPVNQTIAATQSPTRYSAKGLPKGVKINPLTGELTGAPTAPRLVKGQVQPYEVVFTAKNKEGSTSTDPIQWLVTPLADGIVGTFNGLVSRQAAVNGAAGSDTGFGGSIKVVVSTKGSFSGSLKNGADTHGFKGFLEVPEGGGNPEATVTINRKKGLNPLDLTFTVYPLDATGGNAGRLAGQVSLDGQNAAIDAWLAQETGLATGSYNLAFDDITGNATVRPEGSGYAILKVKPRAAVSWTGLLADGTKITGSSTLGANGSAGLYQVLYKKTGSLLMEVVVDPGTEVDGDMTWLKLPQTGKTPGYADGFFARCSVFGGLYTPPAKNARVLDLPENIILELWGGGDVNLVYPATLSAKNAVTVTDAGEKTKLKINAKTGIITGGFEQPGTKVRKAKAYGLMVPGLGGAGFFLLPEDSASRPEILSGALFLGEETP
ncbi:choice-of-anchor tandem repeat GloVer-containing protein [Prosthecobacter sp. SYSU 5D2]|uniref:choice-of-anchor tandem repeat GloVer-containing protein n=1 Tax=Prosthecobacter sp. SYSU 5D2 TaxID=3134134 RepID=UPI0031FEE1BC